MRRYWAQIPLLDVDLKELGEYYFANMGEPGTQDHYRLSSRCIQKLGGNHYLAHTLVTNWVEAPFEEKLRWSVSTLIGRNVILELSKIQKRSAAMHKGDLKLLQESHQRMSDSMQSAQDPALLNTLSAMATLAQATTKEDAVVLYRGVHGAQALAIYDRIKRAESIPIALDHTTSFTSSAMMAGHFAFPTMSRSKTRLGVVLRVVVPRYCILATPLLYKGLVGESETIVASHGSMILHKDDIEVIDGR